MRQLGKAMKIAHHSRRGEKATLQTLLHNYRDTPHPSTGIPPAAMMFRETMSSVFPRRAVHDDDVEAARHYDEQQKLQL